MNRITILVLCLAAISLASVLHRKDEVEPEITKALENSLRIQRQVGIPFLTELATKTLYPLAAPILGFGNFVYDAKITKIKSFINTLIKLWKVIVQSALGFLSNFLGLPGLKNIYPSIKEDSANEIKKTLQEAIVGGATNVLRPRALEDDPLDGVIKPAAKLAYNAVVKTLLSANFGREKSDELIGPGKSFNLISDYYKLLSR